MRWRPVCRRPAWWPPPRPSCAMPRRRCSRAARCGSMLARMCWACSWGVPRRTCWPSRPAWPPGQAWVRTPAPPWSRAGWRSCRGWSSGWAVGRRRPRASQGWGICC
jgi:hypothetical protein